MTLPNILRTAGDYVARAASYVASHTKEVVASAAVIGMLAVPNVAAEPRRDLVDYVNGQRCLNAEAVTLYVVSGIERCESSSGRPVLSNIVEALTAEEGYNVQRGSREISLPVGVHSGLGTGSDSRVIVIPHFSGRGCSGYTVTLESPQGDALMSRYTPLAKSSESKKATGMPSCRHLREKKKR